MDSKTIYVRTGAGEAEIGRRTNALSGDIKRTLLLVDGKSTIEELLKHAAPSLRPAMGAMLKQLLEGGYIEDKAKPKASAAAPAKAAPQQAAKPFKKLEDEGMDLDFTTVMRVPTPEILAAEAEKAKAKAEAEARAEALRRKAEQDAERARAEAAAAKAKAEAEAKARAEAEAKARAESEAARHEAEQAAAQARAEAEALRRKAEQDAERARAEAAAAKAKAEAEAKARAEAEAKARAEFDITKLKTGQGSARSTIATVLFFDIVGYSKLPVARQMELKGQFNELVSQSLKKIDETDRIILDTGDGAAIGFLQHPEDALDVAVQFHAAVTADKHRDYPQLNVRTGIHLGPVNVMKDMNGQFNMIGDGINDAQRIMSFAGTDQIYVSRAYFDVVSRLNAEYAGMFKYRGVQKDKHGREHQVYQVTEGRSGTAERPAAEVAHAPEPEELGIGSIVLNVEQALAPQVPAAPVVPPEPEAPRQSPEQIAAEERAAAEARAQQEEAARRQAETQAKAEAEKHAQEQEAARKLADEQARAWAEAEKRAKRETEQQVKAEHAAVQVASVKPKVGKARRKPLPLGKIAAGLAVLGLSLVAVLPYVWPLQGYVPAVEKRLSARLNQPVHVGRMSAALLPLPKLELQQITAGSGQELKADSIVLHFGFGDLFSDVKPIDRAELNNLQVSGAGFAAALSWLAEAGGVERYPLAKLSLHGARVATDAIKLPAVNGTVEFDAQGHFARAELDGDDGKFNLQLQPQQGLLGLELSLKDTELPVLPGVHFAELNAKGQLRDGEAAFDDADARLYGGSMVGNAKLSWQQGWSLQGHLAVKGLDAQAVFGSKAGIEGELLGDANYSIRGDRLAAFGGNPTLDGKFSLQKGMFGNIDVVETVRLASREGVPGGRTHFDELSGKVALENGVQHYRQLQLSAGVLNASGYLDVDTGGVLNGRFLAELKVRAGNLPLVLSGKVGEPVLRAAR